MNIDTNDLSAFTQLARDYIKLALKEQANYLARQERFNRSKLEAAEAASIAAEVAKMLAERGTPATEIDRLGLEVDLLNQRAAGISREPIVDGAGKRTYSPLVTLLNAAELRLKRAVEARERGVLFGQSF
jgi:hypothetical protein